MSEELDDGMTDVTVKTQKASCVPARMYVRRKYFLELSVISVICHWIKEK